MKKILWLLIAGVVVSIALVSVLSIKSNYKTEINNQKIITELKKDIEKVNSVQNVKVFFMRPSIHVEVKTNAELSQNELEMIFLLTENALSPQLIESVNEDIKWPSTPDILLEVYVKEKNSYQFTGTLWKVDYNVHSSNKKKLDNYKWSGWVQPGSNGQLDVSFIEQR